MRCRRATRSLGAYVDGELAAPARAALEAHLAICDACRLKLGALRALGDHLVGADPTPRVPDGFAARVLAAAKRAEGESAPERVGQSRWRGGRLVPRLRHVPAPLWLAEGCTVALALVLGLFLNLSPRTSPGDGRAHMPEERYGLEWFDPMPPGSIGVAYVEVTTLLGTATEAER